ncbi:MAG: DUF3391 domain-containing protein, partial [Psychrobium sp.]
MKENSASIKLSVDRLQIGVYIKLPVRWNAHPFMFNQFKITSENQITLLRQAKIPHVYAIPSKSTADPLPVNERENPAIIDTVQDTTLLKNKLGDKEQQILAMQQHRRAIKECEKAYQNALGRVRSLTSKIQSRPLLAIEEAQVVMATMTKALLEKDDLILHLVGDDRDDMDSHQHAISVCMLSMMIGKKLKLSSQEISNLGT